MRRALVRPIAAAASLTMAQAHDVKEHLEKLPPFKLPVMSTNIRIGDFNVSQTRETLKLVVSDVGKNPLPVLTLMCVNHQWVVDSSNLSFEQITVLLRSLEAVANDPKHSMNQPSKRLLMIPMMVYEYDTKPVFIE